MGGLGQRDQRLQTSVCSFPLVLQPCRAQAQPGSGGHRARAFLPLRRRHSPACAGRWSRSSGLQGALAREAGRAGVRARAVALQRVGAGAAVLSDSACDAGAFLPLPLPPRPRLPSLRPSPSAEQPPSAAPSCRPPPGPLTRLPVPGCRPSSAEQPLAWRRRSRTVRRGRSGRGAGPRREEGRAGGRAACNRGLGPGKAGLGRPRWGPEAAVELGGRDEAREGPSGRTAGRGRQRCTTQAGQSSRTEAVVEGSAPRRDRLLRSGRRPVAPGDPLGAESSLESRGPESVVFEGLGAALVPGGSHPSGLRNVALIFKARRARFLEGNLVCTQVCRQKGVNMMQECNCNPDPRRPRDLLWFAAAVAA